MPYKHSGEIGDIWKHLPLCTILERENIDRYYETNSAFAEYTLQRTEETNYGIYGLLDKAKRSKIEESRYLQMQYENNFLSTNNYYGSPGLAMEILRKKDVSFYFHDIEKEPLQDIIEFSKRNNIKNVHVFCGDSIPFFLNNYSFSNNDFVLIDPYRPFDGNNRNSFFDIFVKAVTEKAKTVLWYGYENLKQRNYIISRIKELSTLKITCFDIWQQSMTENRCTINPGVPGCGIAVSNISNETIFAIMEEITTLHKLYKNTNYQNGNATLLTSIIST